MNRILWTIFLLLTGLLMAGQDQNSDRTVVQQNEPAELLARFEFNEGTGTTVSCASGAYTGQFVKNVAWVNEGVDGTALEFPDSGYVDTDFAGVLGNDQLSVSAWIRTDSTNRPILWWGKEDVQSKMELKIDASGVFRAQIWGNRVMGQTVVADGQWHHVVCVVDSAGQTDLNYSKLYVDGRLDNVPAANNGNSHDIVNEDNLQIGGLVPNHLWYCGLVDQVAVYKGSLNVEQVAVIYNDELERLIQPNYPAKLMVTFPFNEGEGVQVAGSDGAYSGTFYHNIDWVPEGIDGVCLGFPDSGYVDTDFAGPLGNRQLSVSVWIKSDTTNASFLWWGKEDRQSKMELKIDNSGVFRAQIFGNRVLGTTNVADGQWHHVVCVVDAEGQKDLNFAKLYVDGQLDNNPAANNGVGHHIIGEINLQMGGLTPDHLWYQGFVDQVHVFSGSLTADKVETIYNDENARLVVSGVKNAAHNQPLRFKLEKNYPNPFNPETTIIYELPHDCRVTLLIYNQVGQQVRQLVNEYQQAGRHSVQFNAAQLPSGVYFYRIRADHSFDHTAKMLLLK